MIRQWDERELAEHWSLNHGEFELLANRTDRSRLGFAVLLKFFQVEGRFPTERREVPALALEYLASQVDVSQEALAEYDLGGRSCKRDRVQIRTSLGFRQFSVNDSTNLGDWLLGEVLPVDHHDEHLRKAALTCTELSGVVDLLLANGTTEQATFVLGDPRRALRQADDRYVHYWDPRMSASGNRVAKQLALLLDCLAKMQSWLRYQGRGQL